MIKHLVLLLLASLSLQPVQAHELKENRATLILRDEVHLSATFYINYSRTLHQAMSPAKPYGEFLLTCSAMSNETFRQELTRTQAKLESGTKIFLKNGTQLPIKRWHWPDADRVQKTMRELAMGMIRNPGAHVHEEPLEIRAELTADRKIPAIRVQFPEAFGKMLVVSYRPEQTWVDKSEKSEIVNF